MKRAKFSKPRDTGESHGILKYVRRSPRKSRGAL